VAKKTAISPGVRLLAQSESGQRHAGRALHRDVAPGISAAILELNLLLREPPAVLADAAPAALTRALGALDRSAAALRTVELSLRPPLLDEVGLGPPLRWLASQESAIVEIPERLPRLPAELEWQMFAAIAALVRRGLRGKRAIFVASTRPLTVVLRGARARAYPASLAAARARLAGQAQVLSRSGEIRIRSRR